MVFWVVDELRLMLFHDSELGVVRRWCLSWMASLAEVVVGLMS